MNEDTVHAIKLITRKASERIIKAAFDYAVAHGRKRLPASIRPISSR